MNLIFHTEYQDIPSIISSYSQGHIRDYEN